jgi:hypothetical protein
MHALREWARTTESFGPVTAPKITHRQTPAPGCTAARLVA